MTSGTENKDNIGLSGTSAYVAPEYILDGMRLFLHLLLYSHLSCLFTPLPVVPLKWSLYWSSYKKS